MVLHLRDASHPDRKLQIVSVHETLRKMLSEEQIGRVIDVYNKVDLLEEEWVIVAEWTEVLTIFVVFVFILRFCTLYVVVVLFMFVINPL